jgi:hypothetical protein
MNGLVSNGSTKTKFHLQINIWKLIFFQTVINGLWNFEHILFNLSGNEQFLSRNTTLAYGNAQFFFRAISVCTIDMVEAHLNCLLEYIDKTLVKRAFAADLIR